jgi:hypothetical protein
MAMIAITTSNSINVNPCRGGKFVTCREAEDGKLQTCRHGSSINVKAGRRTPGEERMTEPSERMREGILVLMVDLG